MACTARSGLCRDWSVVAQARDLELQRLQEQVASAQAEAQTARSREAQEKARRLSCACQHTCCEDDTTCIGAVYARHVIALQVSQHSMQRRRKVIITQSRTWTVCAGLVQLHLP